MRSHASSTASRSGSRLRERAEITLETNPGTVEHGRFDEYRRAGVTRISFGVQSFDDDKLRRLGRIHSAAEAERAIKSAQDAGCDNINLDLMYALPEQTLEGALSDVERAVTFEPAHISHYQLTLEPNTLFAAKPPPLPDMDAAWDMQEACQQRLAAAGYAQYEVSAYARNGRRCAHNLNYWAFGDYLGIGAGAHGKITDAAQNTITRSCEGQAAAQLSRTRRACRRIRNLRCGRDDAAAVRVHVECAAPQRRRDDRRIRATHRHFARCARRPARECARTRVDRSGRLGDSSRPKAAAVFSTISSSFFFRSKRRCSKQITIDCPYCGESFSTQIDLSAGSQHYVEDCAVCCRPIEIAIEVGDDGELVAVRTGTDSD